MLRAAGATLLLTAASMPLAVVFGLALAAMRISHRRMLSWPAATYIEVIRGTPLLVQLFVVYYTLPQLGNYLQTDLLPRIGVCLETNPLTWNNWAVGIFCLSANYAAYEAEILRAGLQAIDPGQREAALSLGMSERQAFFIIVLPQAFRVVVPPIINDLIAMLKDSCLVSVIGVPELLFKANGIGKARATVAQMLTVAAALYLTLSLGGYALGRLLEKRLSIRGAPELHVDQPHGH